MTNKIILYFHPLLLVGTAMLVALNAVFSMIIFPMPVIGSGSFMSLALIGTPLCGLLLNIWILPYARSKRQEVFCLFTLAFSALLFFILSGFFAGIPVAGLMPLTGIVMGFCAFRSKTTLIVPCIWLGSIIVSLSTWGCPSESLFLLFLLPHFSALGCCLLLFIRFKMNIKIKVALVAWIATISEWSVLNLIAIYLFGLPPTVMVWVILPVALFERSVALVGSVMVVLALPMIQALLHPYKQSSRPVQEDGDFLSGIENNTVNLQD